MASEGLRFERFYSAAPVCSPTRGSCLTGRHPDRYGIWWANDGHLPADEPNLAELLKARGYATEHFGKWHLGTLSRTIRDGNRGGLPQFADEYAPPWERKFDTCFSTEAKVPTADPMNFEGTTTRYWTGEGEFATENLEGDDSRVIMDRVVPFVERHARDERPFLAVVWFHTPHKPVRAVDEYKRLYRGRPEAQQVYNGALTAMDEQVGRLRKVLGKLGIAEDTLLWFCSDNGPEGGVPGSTGGLRERKRSLYEGGVRVPGILVWPERIAKPRVTHVPCVTSDFLPTVADALGLELPADRPMDGVSLMPLVEGKMTERPRPIGFISRDRAAWTDNRFKIVRPGKKGAWELYDIPADPAEKRDLATTEPRVLARMRERFETWQASVKRSQAGRR